MARRFWLNVLSLVPGIGEPLAFWFGNRKVIGDAAHGAKAGLSEGGVGGGLIGLAAGLGQERPGGGGNDFGAMLKMVAEDPATDPRLLEELKRLAPKAQDKPKS